MIRFNDFLVNEGLLELETPNEFNPEKQLPPMSITTVDRNNKPIVLDMELLAQYNRYTAHDDIQELYAKFIANIHGLFADFIQIYHSDLLEEYGGKIIRADGEPYFEVELPKRVFANIWANRTSEQFQNIPKYFLFGIIVRDFNLTDKELEEALLNHRRHQEQDDDDDEGF
jgi:hypothetical protein